MDAFIHHPEIRKLQRRCRVWKQCWVTTNAMVRATLRQGNQNQTKTPGHGASTLRSAPHTQTGGAGRGHQQWVRLPSASIGPRAGSSHSSCDTEVQQHHSDQEIFSKRNSFLTKVCYLSVGVYTRIFWEVYGKNWIKRDDHSSVKHLWYLSTAFFNYTHIHEDPQYSKLQVSCTFVYFKCIWMHMRMIYLQVNMWYLKDTACEINCHSQTPPKKCLGA